MENKDTRPYVKLGAKSSSFFAPYTRFKLGKGEIKELPESYSRDMVIMGALSGGHISYAADAEVREYLRNVKTEGIALVGDHNSYKAENVDLKKQLVDQGEVVEKQRTMISEKDKSIELLELGKENIFKYDENDLTKYIITTYELDKSEEKKFNKMTFEEKKAYAYDLEKNSVE